MIDTPPTLKVKRLHDDAKIPKYQTAGAACFDVHAVIQDEEPTPDGRRIVESMTVDHGLPVTIDTGLAFEVPEGFVMLIYSRSGHGFIRDVRLANCVGVIDSDYRGELRVRLTADGKMPMKVNHGDRIAQCMLLPVQQWALVEVDELSGTGRGAGAYGSTGA